MTGSPAVWLAQTVSRSTAPVASNILAKSGYALALGGREYGLRFALFSILGLATGAVLRLTV